jgi:hypothetical protein
MLKGGNTFTDRLNIQQSGDLAVPVIETDFLKDANEHVPSHQLT